jgi:hypothetical protein
MVALLLVAVAAPAMAASPVRAVRWLAAGIGIAAGAYAALVGLTWCRYGHVAPADADDADAMLDRFMPSCDVADRHHVRVRAPAEIALAAAAETDLQQSAIVRSIFNARAFVLGSTADPTIHPRGLVAQVLSLGWGVLAEVPGREMVFGAVTQPWMPNVLFRAVPPGEFAAFSEPGYVKIVWTLRADPSGPDACVFRTETRVATTDSSAKARFRWYWARFSPGIVLIRRVMLGLLKTDAERRVRLQTPAAARIE